MPTMSNRFVAYYRVSTKKQGASGLGLDAQRADLAAFVERTGGAVAKEFIEVESGKNNERPQLQSAIAFARRSKATLLVAKLDRLSRNVAFLANLMDSNLDFIAVDNPHANRFTVHILAAVAEHERELIAKRTKAALGAAKARGVKLGSARPGHWRGREAKRLEGAKLGAKRAAKAHRENARNAYTDVAPLIREMHAAGKSLRQIAAALNEQGIPTRRGKTWGAAQVRNVLIRE
jgi:DNA invertase Pin-like site-specific DNA recombinase